MNTQSSAVKFGLTSQQAQCLAFIRKFVKRHPHSPSYREIADGIGTKSMSQITHLVHALEQRGHIARVSGASRSLVVIP